MDEILEILADDARVTAQEIAKLTGKSEEVVRGIPSVVSNRAGRGREYTIPGAGPSK